MRALFNAEPDKLNFEKYVQDLILHGLQDDIKANTRQLITDYDEGRISEEMFKNKIEELHKTFEDKKHDIYEKELYGSNIIQEYRKLKAEDSDLELTGDLKFLSQVLGDFDMVNCYYCRRDWEWQNKFGIRHCIRFLCKAKRKSIVFRY